MLGNIPIWRASFVVVQREVAASVHSVSSVSSALSPSLAPRQPSEVVSVHGGEPGEKSKGSSL